MNRILRPILRRCVLRTLLLFATIFYTSVGYSQLTIDNCPPGIETRLPTPVCQGEYFVDPITFTYAGTGMVTLEWQPTGATMSSNPLPIETLYEGAGTTNIFNFGLTQITITADDGMGNTDECQTVLFVSEATNIPLDVCDDVTVDLEDGCNGIVNAADEVLIPTVMCDENHEDILNFSWSNATRQQELVVNAHDGNPSFYQLYLTKYRDGAMFRQGFCNVQVTLENPRQPALVCPSSETILVAPGCAAAFNFDVEGASTAPCMGSITQSLGSPSGTLLTAGVYDYQFDLEDTDDADNNQSCAFQITVEESNLASTQLSCIGQTNVSIDQNCMATIDVPTILTGGTCTPMAMFTLSAIINGVEQTGTTLTFTDANVGQTIDVSVIGPNALNSCWGTVTIEDKIGPAIICPADTIIQCTMPSDTSATGIPDLVGSGCTDVTIYFNDAVINNMCRGDFQSVISRRFFAEDGAGNLGAPCTQTISVERESLLSALLPPHWDGIATHSGIQDNGVGSNPPLACDGAGIVYDTIVRADGRVVPSPYPNGDLIGTGAPGNVGTCGTIFSFYEDIIIDVCEEECAQNSPSYKVLRTWDVFDWCSGSILIHQQIIKVVDSIAPVFEIGVPDLTVSTDLWGCGASIYLPLVSATDNCSSEISYSWSVNNGTYDPVSNRVHLASNALTELGEEIQLIAYATDCCGNIAADTGFVTIVDLVPPVVVADEHTVVTLNNQSEDGHTKVKAESFDDGSFDGCGPIDYWVRRMDVACVDFDGDPEDEKDEINDWHKEIHFCCMDLEEEQMIVFMVCDDGDRDGIVENNGDDNCGTAMILVTVQDKLAPTINCPPATTINCIDFVAYADLLGTDLTEDDISRLDTRFGAAFSNSTCGMLDGQTFVSNLDEVCGVGAVTRGFTVTTTNGQASCTQSIAVVGDEDNLLSCDRISFPIGSEEEKANYDWCDPSDEVEPFVQTIQILECGNVNIQEPLIDRDGLCTEAGINLTLDTFNFAGGACVKILAHWEVIDQCFFDENFVFDEEVDPFRSENGYYELYIEYDIFDTDAPDLACDDITVETADCEFNYDVFTMVATDDCTSADLISITYKVDLGNDGTYDIPSNGSAAEGNSFDAEEIGGLPIGTHAIKWIAYDGCGNYETCVQEIEVVKVRKAPTPYCHLGLSSAVMDEQFGCSVEFWASDFAVDGFDDCDDSVTVLMIPYQDIYGDPADLDDDLTVEGALDMAMPNWTFGCEYIENGVSHVVELRIYFVDEDGVFDFCDASLTLNDNFDCCEDLDLGGASMITGNIASSEGVILEDVNVNIMTNHPEFPRIQSTTKEGSYVFNSLPKSMNYEITPANNSDAKEGVTTLDIVLIQRHILGIAKLDSPHKIIAADINGNEKVSAADLLQLRKLILGLYSDDKFPDNSSWRFVNNDFNFVNAASPFPFAEKIDVMNLSQAMYNQNFVGVKIGDVNGSISASRSNESVKRSEKSATILLNDAIAKEGERVLVEVTAADLAEMYGLQFALDFDEEALAFSEVEGVAIALDESNLAIKEGQLLVSWNSIEVSELAQDAVLFTIEFTAKTDGQLSSFINLNSAAMKAEAYNKDLEVVNLELGFRGLENLNFQLLQNAPNPFNGKTNVSFVLPENGSAIFRVVDVTGQVILERNETFNMGQNVITVNNSDLGSSGIYYYQVIYKDESASRKMILLD